jgi:hypothetical protein
LRPQRVWGLGSSAPAWGRPRPDVGFASRPQCGIRSGRRPASLRFPGRLCFPSRHATGAQARVASTGSVGLGDVACRARAGLEGAGAVRDLRGQARHGKCGGCGSPASRRPQSTGALTDRSGLPPSIGAGAIHR